ncbi:MAG: LEA type 2 family protein [Propionivibrio sp.]|uniref:LEA type 2 family protein n=1 Tax=Propionivibrio sp. TaxID=2212460 RepID=UPI001A3662B7|nr:LEA type 2 family protein [Propionivibrio sp.]MBL8413857.1 LEA type 2 family protein [Propionivibrio sp.]
MRRVCWVLFFVVVSLLAACAPRLQKPEISLAGIDLVGLGLVEQRFVLKLRIRNPNDVDLPVNALNFDVELNARHFARGVSDKPVIVPRQGETILEVKTVSRLGDVLKPLRDAQKNGRERIAYRVFGSVDLEGFGSFPFDRSGDVPMSALEKFAPK